MIETNNLQIQQVLAQMRSMSIQAGAGPESIGTEQGQSISGSDTSFSFGKILKQSVDAVNAQQKTAGDLTRRLEMGDPQVRLADVMIAGQKSSIAFEAMTQVRNKMISAYQDIMNMQV